MASETTDRIITALIAGGFVPNDLVRRIIEASVVPLERENAALRMAITDLREYAAATWDYWETDHDAKVGKRLKALSGGLPKYDARIDEILGLGTPRAAEHRSAGPIDQDAPAGGR